MLFMPESSAVGRTVFPVYIVTEMKDCEVLKPPFQKSAGTVPVHRVQMRPLG
jgi:hypothetical protein